MNGQELYALYEQKNHELLNCGVDQWDELSADDQSVWDAMAVAFMEEIERQYDIPGDDA
jgi:hypothetical protein